MKQTKFGNKGLENTIINPSIQAMFTKASSGAYQIKAPIIMFGNKYNGWDAKSINLLANSIPEDEFFETDEHIIQFFNLYWTLFNEDIFNPYRDKSRNIKVHDKVKDKFKIISSTYTPEQRLEYLKILTERAEQDFNMGSINIKDENGENHRQEVWAFKSGNHKFGNIPFGSGVVVRVGNVNKDQAIVDTVETILMGKGFGTALITSGHMKLYNDASDRLELDYRTRYELGVTYRYKLALSLSPTNAFRV